MEEAQEKIYRNKDKSVVLVGKCGKCKREFWAETTLPSIMFSDGEGNTYRDVISPHLIVLCPYCFGLLNLAKRVATNEKRRENGN